MKPCENCDILNDGKYGSGRFCSCKCARGFSTKNKRTEINKKVSKSLTGKGNVDVIKICLNCNVEFLTSFRRRIKNYCTQECKNSCLIIREKISKIKKELCSDINERNRLREIGRKGGFGKKGFTSGNIKFESTLEKICFEYLENNNIKFIPHKRIPNSSKISDVYLEDFDLWIELDGIDREKRKKWLGKNYDYWLEKIEIYKREKLNYIIVKSLKEFIKVIAA